ncbi:Spy/CpxP family protein refolding chaperone [Streptomyces aurantiacus]|uniref:hypothetical protein n=1 Tax=Streptomyces aurantiacus TaxID=47760 RepID=UPI0027941BF9|nr:hypothetical protein [Streptomyces aurantiacus]MDQ0773502.1 Spy/CpxP family protein refolding chaperone [Streptomyces aurantiacus]
MSFQLRRLVALALAALALTAGATATATAAAAASASARPAQAVNQPAADDFDGYPGEGHGHGHGQERPLHFGPFEIPRNGTVSGGFSWGMRG